MPIPNKTRILASPTKLTGIENTMRIIMLDLSYIFPFRLIRPSRLLWCSGGPGHAHPTKWSLLPSALNSLCDPFFSKCYSTLQVNASRGQHKLLLAHYKLFIPVTRRVKAYTRFVGKYVTGRRKRFRPHKIDIFFIRITSRVDLAMSVCPYERCDLRNYNN